MTERADSPKAPRDDLNSVWSHRSGPKRALHITKSLAATRVRFVLIEPRRGVNVGQAARALKNFGFARLITVGGAYEESEARGIATQSSEVVENLQRVASLDEAIRGATLVVGTTPRKVDFRSDPYTLRGAMPHLLQAIDAAEEGGADGELAILFGPEWRGLSDPELDLCSHLVTIPTAPEQPSLNLAHSVALVAYEMFMALYDPPPRERTKPIASHHELLGAINHLDEVLVDIGFMPPQGNERITRSTRDFVYRLAPTSREIHTLRGVLSHVQFWLEQRKVERVERRERQKSLQKPGT